MVTIEIELLTNSYGGSPWNSATNEGKTEIIPSPLRIIRAILSGLYNQSYVETNEFDNLNELQKEIFDRLSKATN